MMKWVYRIKGEHTHVKVYINGAFSGSLTFRNNEFEQIKEDLRCKVSFANVDSRD